MLSIKKTCALPTLVLLITGQLSADGLQPDRRNTIAPALKLNDLSGRTHQLTQYRGQVVLVNFWATWCPPCRAEMPSIWRLKQKLKDKPFQVVTVNMGENRETITAFLPERMQRDFVSLMDSDTASMEDWKVTALPATYLIDREGRIAYSVYGAVEWDQATSVDRVNRLLGD